MEKEKIYAEIPKFDQGTQYVIQVDPVESEKSIYYGVKVLDMSPEEKGLDGDFMP